MKIADRFNGYLNINGFDFSFTYADQIVTLLPALSGSGNQYKSRESIVSRDDAIPEFLYGMDEEAPIAFMRTTDFGYRRLTFAPSLWFSPPLIIKANGNADGYYNELTEEWDQFHAMVFSGGNINAIYDPEIAISKNGEHHLPEEVNTIRLLEPREYTKSTNAYIDGENVTVKFSVMRKWTIESSKSAGYSLGTLDAYVAFSFEQAKGLDSIKKYYNIAKSLISLMTGQNNVFFKTDLYQRNHDGKLFHSAICTIFDGYENYSTRNRYSVIPLNEIIDQIPLLIELLGKNQLESFFTLLPENNKWTGVITITNVQDLCTALEVSYEWKKRQRKKDTIIEELKKNIKCTIKSFTEEHPEIDVSNETTISSAFQYLDYTLKDRIWTLYLEHKEAVDAISKRRSLPYLTIDNITDFVKMRNGKTHDGVIDWGNRAAIYPLLFALEYVCVLEHIGVPEEKIQTIILQLF